MKITNLFRSAALLAVVIVFSPDAFAQLGFNPNIVNGVIQFGEVPVGNSSRQWVTFIGMQRDDAMMDVSVQIQGENFTANPANFRIEPQQQVAVAFEFRPPRAGQFQVAVRIVAGSNQGRQFIYDATLVGVGVVPPAPNIEVAPNAIRLLVEEAGGSDEESLTIRNSGNAELSWNKPAFNAGWLTVAPRNGRIAAGRETAIRLTTNNLPEENGDYQVTLRITSNDPDQAEVRIPVTLTMAIPNVETQTIHLRAGWNMISLNVTPGDEYRDNGVLTPQSLTVNIRQQVYIIKDYVGNFCMPTRNFWGIREWDLTQGYWIKTTEAVDWEIVGDPIPVDNLIHLQHGWNVIAYYPRRNDDPINLFRALENAGVLMMVKGPLGQFYRPNYHFEWLLRPNDGVMVKVSQAVDFRYPD